MNSKERRIVADLEVRRKLCHVPKSLMHARTIRRAGGQYIREVQTSKEEGFYREWRNIGRVMLTVI